MLIQFYHQAAPNNYLIPLWYASTKLCFLHTPIALKEQTLGMCIVYPSQFYQKNSGKNTHTYNRNWLHGGISLPLKTLKCLFRSDLGFFAEFFCTEPESQVQVGRERRRAFEVIKQVTVVQSTSSAQKKTRRKLLVSNMWKRQT